MSELKAIANYNGLELSETLHGMYTWNEAMELSETHQGWRLPKLWELRMFYEEHPETRTNSWFWSASPYAYFSDYAWRVYFYGGSVGSDDKSHAHRVRLVRDIRYEKNLQLGC